MTSLNNQKEINRIQTPSKNQQLIFNQPHFQQNDIIKQELPSVIDAKKKLDNLIEDLNQKLISHFRIKQQQLLNHYKEELIQQQKKLTQLKNTTNEEQIRVRMLQRKSQLEKQRNHLIQTNMFFSKKCQQYKQVYNKLIQDSKDLEKEIEFLDMQILQANQKKLEIVDEIVGTQRNEKKVGGQDQLLLFTKKKEKLPQIQLNSDKKERSTLQKSLGTHSVRKIGQSLHLPTNQKPKKSISTRQFQKIDKAILTKTVIQRIFQECVEQVKSRRKNKRTMPILKGQQFTQFQKKAIMELFLSNQQVKKKLYEIIFAEEKTYKRGFPKDLQKAKITYDQFPI